LASLVAFRFLLGLAEPGGLTGAVKTVSARFNAAQRGLVTGFFIAGTAVGSLIATPLIVLLSVRYGWRAAFLIAGAAGFLWAPLWLLATRNGRHDATPAEPLGEKRRGLAVLKDRRARAYVVARLFGDGLPYFLMFWLPEYLMSARHFSFALVGLIGWIPFLATDAGALLGGWLSGRLVRSGLPPLFSRKTMMSTASLFVGAGAWLQCFDAPWQVLLSLCFCTFGAGIWSANSHSIPGDAFPSSVVATVHGLGGSAGAIGGILLNTAVGQLSEAGSYWTIFLILATLQPLGVSSLWLWLHDEQGRRRELVT
jgi:ACS family hexuronate transporter-like MFS transporter